MGILCTVDIASSGLGLTMTDEPGPGGADADDVEISDAPGVERLPACRRNQQVGVDTRKRKVIEIPMV